MEKQLPLKDIRIDGGTQQRPVDTSVVDRYAAMMQEGSVFPPIDLVFDGHSYFLWNGFHRMFAAKKLQKTYLATNVTNGTQRDAIWLSFSANKENGFPRQAGTAKEIVEKILKDEAWSKMSAREIANHVGVTERYIFKIQSETSKSYPMNSSEDKPDSNAKKQLFRAGTRDVKRGDSEYEAKVPEKIVKDSKGKVVPEHLVQYFERANEYRQKIKVLNDMLKWVKDGKDKNDLFFKYIKIENLTAEIGNVKRIFRFALPYAVCRYCGGDVNNAECRACDGCGFVNEAVYDATPRDLK